MVDELNIIMYTRMDVPRWINNDSLIVQDWMTISIMKNCSLSICTKHGTYGKLKPIKGTIRKNQFGWNEAYKNAQLWCSYNFLLSPSGFQLHVKNASKSMCFRLRVN